MKIEFKESKEFKPVTFCVTFETLEEMKIFGTALTDSGPYILGDVILEYIKKHYDDTNER